MFDHRESEGFSLWRMTLDPSGTVGETHYDTFFGKIGGNDHAGVAGRRPLREDEDETDIRVDVVFV